MATIVNEKAKSAGRESSNDAVDIIASVPGPCLDGIRLTPYTYVAAAAIVLGIALRLVGYMARWPLNIDEARLAINIASRTPAQLMHPLDFEQTAPLGLLWTDWGLTRVFGVNEYVLRAVPLLTGALLVVLLWHLGRRMLGPRQGAVAALLGAGAPLLLYYGGAYSIKQYGVDAFVTAAILASGVAVLRHPEATRSWLGLAIVGLVAEWASEPAALVLAGVGPVILIASMARQPRKRVVWWGLAMGALWVASFWILYIVMYRPVSTNAYMARFWGLTPGRPADGALRSWFLSASQMWVRPFVALDAGRFAAAKLATACVTIGVVLIAWRRGWRWAAILAGPYVVLVTVIALRLYPSADRLALFAVPCLILIFSEVVVRAVDLAPRPIQGAILTTVLVVGAGSALIYSLVGAHLYWPEEDSRPLVERVLTSGAAEPVYVMARGVPAWLFYSTDWQHPDRTRLRWMAEISSAASGPAFENARSRGRAVSQEGDSLIDDYRDRRELIGLGSGVEHLRWGSGSSKIDSGWADNEARRMRAAARPTVWIFASHQVFPNQPPGGAELAALMAAIYRANGRVASSDVRSNAALYEVRF